MNSKGPRGEQRGKGAAALDAAGAGWGSPGLACFALVIWWQVRELQPIICLGAASLIWFAVAVSLWRLRRALRSAALSLGEGAEFLVQIDPGITLREFALGFELVLALPADPTHHVAVNPRQVVSEATAVTFSRARAA